MATLWSCPKSDCPPTEIAPVDVPESGESAGAEPERPSPLMRLRRCSMFPLTPSLGLRVIRCTRRAITEGAMWSGGWRSKG